MLNGEGADTNSGIYKTITLKSGSSVFLWGFYHHRNLDKKSNIILWLLQDILAQQACLDQ